MSNTPPDLNQAWQGLEPEQPKPNRGVFLVALATVIFFLIGALALGYVALQQRQPATTEPSLPTETPLTEMVTTADATAITATDTPNLAPTATLPGGVTPIPPATTADVIASRPAVPPVINGEPSEWYGLPIYLSPHIVFTSQDWDGSDDLEASWQVAWDDVYLYLVAIVADDIHVQTQPARTAYRGDSVELQIDTGRTNNLNSSLNPNTFQISLSPGDFSALPPSAWRFQGTPAGEMLDAPGPHSISVAALPSGVGYTLEAAIPWRDLNLAPAAGLTIGLAVNFNDNDTPGTATQEMMKSNAPNRQFRNPATWGTLRLE